MNSVILLILIWDRRTENVEIKILNYSVKLTSKIKSRLCSKQTIVGDAHFDNNVITYRKRLRGVVNEIILVSRSQNVACFLLHCILSASLL